MKSKKGKKPEKGQGWIFTRENGNKTWHASELAAQNEARKYRADNPEESIRGTITGPQGQLFRGSLDFTSAGRGEGYRVVWN
jgi:hypothetical protein